MATAKPPCQFCYKVVPQSNHTLLQIQLIILTDVISLLVPRVVLTFAFPTYIKTRFQSLYLITYYRHQRTIQNERHTSENNYFALEPVYSLVHLAKYYLIITHRGAPQNIDIQLQARILRINGALTSNSLTVIFTWLDLAYCTEK